MLTNVRIRNYRSFVDASAQLTPFTLVIGPNGAGKSNFLKLFWGVSGMNWPDQGLNSDDLASRLQGCRHLNYKEAEQHIELTDSDLGRVVSIKNGRVANESLLPKAMLYALKPETISKPEKIELNPRVAHDGTGAVRVLDELKNGDQDNLFEQIESDLRRYVPTIEKLSSRTVGSGMRELQVRERDVKEPFPVSMLSDGTRLILMILTIIHSPNAPRIICLEDIDHGLHPRLFGKLVERLRSITQERGIQIIASTHNPYFVDEFVHNEDAVLIIEKENGASKITALSERLESGESVEGALGELWYGGFLGGVPDLRPVARSLE